MTFWLLLSAGLGASVIGLLLLHTHSHGSGGDHSHGDHSHKIQSGGGSSDHTGHGPEVHSPVSDGHGSELERYSCCHREGHNHAPQEGGHSCVGRARSSGREAGNEGSVGERGSEGLRQEQGFSGHGALNGNVTMCSRRCDAGLISPLSFKA